MFVRTLGLLLFIPKIKNISTEIKVTYNKLVFSDADPDLAKKNLVTASDPDLQNQGKLYGSGFMQ